jgi:hypothetical protein
MLTDNAGAQVANIDTLVGGPSPMATITSPMSSQESSSFIDAVGTVECHCQVRSGSMVNAGPAVSNWTRACHALRLPRCN